MATALLVIHILIALALIGVVLVQRSEGGALGIGGGGSMMSGRGSANALTKLTAALAACFFLSSIGLTILGRTSVDSGSRIDAIKVKTPDDATKQGDNNAKKKTDGNTTDKKTETPGGPVIPAP